jgi:Cof subfamily protein (haloacid dehalogenase superfamily)
LLHASGASVVGLERGGRYAAWTAPAPRLVALDVDGTLVTRDQLPAVDVLAAIERLVDAGVQVGLATGRMPAANAAILGTGVFTGPHVFHNGALVTDADGTERVALGLSDGEVDAVLDFGRSRDDLTIEVYVDGTYLVDRDDPRSTPHAELLGLAPVARIRSAGDLGGRAAIKAVVVCFSKEASAAAGPAIVGLGLAAGPAASPATPGLRYVNVTRNGIDKGAGVAAAAALAGVDRESIAAVGDETNDLPMLEIAGTAIAMGDATPAVRARAHLVAPTFGAGGTIAALTALTGLAERTLR